MLPAESFTQGAQHQKKKDHKKYMVTVFSNRFAQCTKQTYLKDDLKIAKKNKKKKTPCANPNYQQLFIGFQG